MLKILLLASIGLVASTAAATNSFTNQHVFDLQKNPVRHSVANLKNAQSPNLSGKKIPASAAAVSASAAGAKTVDYAGYTYQSLDQVDIDSDADGCADDQAYSLPDGWEVAPKNDDIIANVVAKHTWGTDCMIVSDGSSWGASRGCSIATAGTDCWPDKSSPVVSHEGDSWKVLTCNRRILIRKKAFDWVTGAGKGWKLSSTPGPYDNCEAYDLCTLQYAVDGTAENPGGKSFDFNAPDGPPYTLTIDMNTPATFDEWRFFTGGYPCYGAEHVSLQYKDTSSGAFVDVPDAALHFTTAMNYSETKFMRMPFSAPVTAQVWRVNGKDKLRHDEHSCFFQTYFQEVQFRNSKAPAPPAPGPAPTKFKVGDRVRVKPSIASPSCMWGGVQPGDCGTVTGLDSGGCMGDDGLDVDFAAQSGWHAVSAEMELCSAPLPPSTFKVGDRVRVKPSVQPPSCGWGEVKPGDCGTVKVIDGTGCAEGDGFYADFASQSHWHAQSKEMELCSPAPPPAPPAPIGYKPCASRPTVGANVTVHSVDPADSGLCPAAAAAAHLTGVIRTDDHDGQPYQLSVDAAHSSLETCWFREDELWCQDGFPPQPPSGEYERCKNRPSVGTPVQVAKVDSADAGTCVATCVGTVGAIVTDAKDEQPFQIKADGACGTCWYRQDEVFCAKEKEQVVRGGRPALENELGGRQGSLRGRSSLRAA